MFSPLWTSMNNCCCFNVTHCYSIVFVLWTMFLNIVNNVNNVLITFSCVGYYTGNKMSCGCKHNISIPFPTYRHLYIDIVTEKPWNSVNVFKSPENIYLIKQFCSICNNCQTSITRGDMLLFNPEQLAVAAQTWSNHYLKYIVVIDLYTTLSRFTFHRRTKSVFFYQFNEVRYTRMLLKNHNLKSNNIKNQLVYWV